jgi:hypothetical protein
MAVRARGSLGQDTPTLTGRIHHMKRIIIAVAIAYAGIAYAATAPAGPITLEAKQGNVTFKHDTHKGADCKKCHGEGEPKKIGKMEKEAAHKMCQECHKAEKKGPQKCGDCHVKAK